MYSRELLFCCSCESVVEAVVSAVVKAVDCCRLFCALESSSFVKAVESVVIILKLLNQLL